MPNDPAPPPTPGDIVQVTGPRRTGLLVVVEDLRPWGATGYSTFPRQLDGPVEQTPIRLQAGEFVRVGTVAVASPALAQKRAAAIATAADRPVIGKPEEPAGDDLVTRFDVEVRFNGRTTGSGQVYRERVEADSVEEAYDKVRVPVMDHGGSVCIVGVTIDEARR